MGSKPERAEPGGFARESEGNLDAGSWRKKCVCVRAQKRDRELSASFLVLQNSLMSQITFRAVKYLLISYST